jgi:hypothetical protein
MFTNLLQHFTVGFSAEHVLFKWVEHLGQNKNKTKKSIRARPKVSCSGFDDPGGQI